jgi:hypothetical protein
VCDNLNLSITLLADCYDIAQVSSSAVHLDAIVKELFELGEVEDLVVDRLGAVEDKLLGDLLALLGSALLLLAIR